MFVLHPSSRCDVCLEAFSWEANMAPFAIPCGHVFCRTCLEAVVPPKCPMCRKSYDPARLKKLHVDRPDGSEDPKEGEYLQRIAMSFDAPEDHLRELVVELDAWLQQKPAESCVAVRKARMALDKYQELRFMGIESKHEISRLRQEMNDMRQIMASDRERANLVEMELLQKKDELEIQVEDQKTELDALRSEISRNRPLKNPLPAPPQPVSFPRYPPFDPKFNANARPSWYADPNGNHIGFQYGPASRNFWPDDERENHSPAEANGTKRKGKGTEAASHFYPRPVTVTSVLDIPMNPNPAPFPTPKPQAGVLPGASDSSKFVPSSPRTDAKKNLLAWRPPTPPPTSGEPIVDPFTLTTTLLPEYTSGFLEGFSQGSGNRVQLQQPEASTSAAASGSGDASSSTSAERRERRERREREREKEKERERRRRAKERGGEETRERGERTRGSDRERERERRERHHRERQGDSDSRRNPRERTRRANTTSDTLSETISSLSAATRSSRAEDDASSHRPRRRRTSDADAQQPDLSMATILTESPHRRRRRDSAARPATSAALTRPRRQSQASSANTPASSSPTSLHSALHTSPVEQLQNIQTGQSSPERPQDGDEEELLRTPASRHSIQSQTSNASSWGTVPSRLSPASVSTMDSIFGTDARPSGLMNFSRMPAQSTLLVESPARTGIQEPEPSREAVEPVVESSSEEEEDDDEEDGEDTEMERPNPTTNPATNNGIHGRPGLQSRNATAPAGPVTAVPVVGNGGFYHTAVPLPDPQARPRSAYPASASAALPSQLSHAQAQAFGSRHTQAVYQPSVSTYPQQPPPQPRPPPLVVPPVSASSQHTRDWQRSQAEMGWHSAVANVGSAHSHAHSRPMPNSRPAASQPPHSQTHSYNHHRPQSGSHSSSRSSHNSLPSVNGDTRSRRSSVAPIDTPASVTSSLSALSLHGLQAGPPPSAGPWGQQSEAESSSDEEEEEVRGGLGFTGNALGLAILPPPTSTGEIPISAPRPRPSNHGFLQTFNNGTSTFV